jgi:hypothetical protein
MIDFQSSAIAKSQNHLTVILRHARVLPAGEGRGSSERGERHFLCCSFVGEAESFEIELSAAYGEGELNHRGRQSTLIKIKRTFPTQPPGGTQILPGLAAKPFYPFCLQQLGTKPYWLKTNRLDG